MMSLFCLRRERSLLGVYHMHGIGRSTRIAELGASSCLGLLGAIEIKKKICGFRLHSFEMLAIQKSCTAEWHSRSNLDLLHAVQPIDSTISHPPCIFIELFLTKKPLQN